MLVTVSRRYRLQTDGYPVRLPGSMPIILYAAKFGSVQENAVVIYLNSNRFEFRCVSADPFTADPVKALHFAIQV